MRDRQLCRHSVFRFCFVICRLPGTSWRSAGGSFVISKMYQRILIPLENSSADETILAHIKPLVRMTGAKLLLVHVSDGWVARNFNQLKLAESEEMRGDRAYLEKRSRELAAEGLPCEAVLALGEPSDEIIKLAREKNVDLIAMTTHGHRLISDILYGATADKVRHEVDVPVLLLKVKN